MNKLKSHFKAYKHIYIYGALGTLIGTTYLALTSRIDGHEKVITNILKTLESEEIISNLKFN